VKRRLFAILSAISLVLCLLSAAVWVRGYFATDGIARARVTVLEPRYYEVTARSLLTHQGAIVYLMDKERGWADSEVKDESFWARSNSPPGSQPVTLTPSESILNRMGFGSIEWPAHLAVWFPCWLLCITFAVLPLLWLQRRWRRSRRIGHGRCQTCGYDLRATPERCPECGAVAAEVVSSLP
jgi:hypothetical protein